MSDPRKAVLVAMRRRGDETQLTRTITALAGLDPTLVPQLADKVLATSAHGGNARAGEILKCVPRSLGLRGEGALGRVRQGRRASGGRVDWELSDDSFRLVVEVKIDAKLATGQLERYLASFARDEVTGGLVLLTRAAEAVPPGVTRHRHWLGQIRWDELLPRLAHVSPADPAVAAEWALLLRVIQRPGDLADEPVGWQLGGRKVGDRNRLVLAAVRDQATETVASELAARAGLAKADGLCGARPGGRSRSVVTSGDAARLTLYVPAVKGQPVIEVELAGTRAPLKLTTAVDPGYPPLLRRRNDHAQAVRALVDRGFGEERDGWYAARDRVAPTDDEATPATALRALLDTRLRAIVASGILDSLTPSKAGSR